MSFLNFLSMVDERLKRQDSKINGCVGNRICDFIWTVDRNGIRLHKDKEKFIESSKKKNIGVFDITYPLIKNGKVVTVPLKDIYPNNSIFYFICDQEFSKDWHRIYCRRLEIAFENPIEYYYMNIYRSSDDFFVKQNRIFGHVELL